MTITFLIDGWLDKVRLRLTSASTGDGVKVGGEVVNYPQPSLPHYEIQFVLVVVYLSSSQHNTTKEPSRTTFRKKSCITSRTTVMTSFRTSVQF